LLFLPVPLITGAEGMVWVTEQAQVFAGTDGFVREVLAPSGTAVEVGDPILRIEDPLLDTRIAVVAARLAELRAQRAAERLESRLRLAITDEAIAAVEAELSRVREQAAALFVKSPTAGTFVPPSGRWLEGRFVHQGEVVGVVVDPHHFIVRAVVPQSDIGLVRTHNERVEIRLAEHLDRVFPAQIVREVPSGTAQLPSRILGAAGGGEIPIDTHDEQGLTAAEKVFQVELGLPPDIPVVGIGGRVYVRFHHGREPLARQWARAARQLLLSKLAT
jgi:putative peptide zinc metalloprotease protein